MARLLNSKSPPTRYRNGLTNIPPNQANNLYPAQDPSRVIEYFDDFLNPADLTATSPVTWTLTKGGSSTSTAGTGTAALGGRILLTTGATSGNSIEAQSNQDSFVLTALNRWWVKFNCQISSATVNDVDLLIGLQAINTAPLSATNGVWYRQTTGAATGTIVLSKAGTATTSATVNTAITATDFSIGFSYDPWSRNDSGTIGAVHVYVNDVHAGVKLVPTNIPTVSLAPVMFIKTNSNNARVLQVDYLHIANDRTQIDVV